MVLSLLGITLTLGVFNAIGRLLIAPGARHDYFRVLPLSTRLAVFWYRWMMAIVAVFAIGGGGAQPARDHRRVLHRARRDRHGMAGGGGRHADHRRSGSARPWRTRNPISRVVAVVLTMACIFGWIFAAMQLKALFWTLVVFIVVPMLMDRVREGVRNVVRLDDPNQPKDAGVITWAVLVERAHARADRHRRRVCAGRRVGRGPRRHRHGRDRVHARPAGAGAHRDRAAGGGCRVAADPRGDRRTGSTTSPPPVAHDDLPEARKRQRLRTLLPILRNFLLVLIVAVTVLMVLDALGIQIGPLLAGAGVVGIAIGFGAQTLVKDIISGMFYLLDDAFRVGEYIQAGSHKGTVEVVLAALDQAAAPPRTHRHGAVRRARRGAEHEPRLGDRQDHGRRAPTTPTSTRCARSSSRSASS